MHKLLFLGACILAIIFQSCKDSEGNLRSYLNHEQLKKQIFELETDRDTILLTENGSVVKIPKGTLKSDRNPVKLEIKEALTTTDIVISGLTTMSGNRPLSSGGMIYIDAAQGYNIEIKKELEVLIPTKDYNPDMQVFKGEDRNGKIDWTDPSPLPPDETLKKIKSGEALFKANCASCHKIDKEFTGPRLYGVTDRRSRDWLYAFTRNPMKLINEGYYTKGQVQEAMTDSSKAEIIPDFYSACLAHKWRPAVMTSFPLLSDTTLDALYAYIKSESDKLPRPAGTGLNCCDSCDIYGKALFDASGGSKNWRPYEEYFFTLDRTIPITTGANDTTPVSPATTMIDTPSLVVPKIVKATYYTINIQAFGWYNIDVLMKEDTRCSPSELFVRIRGSYQADLNVVLIIPADKVFVEGGKLNDGKQYGFYETDGTLPLPQNEQCYVLAFGEYENKLIFGKSSFIAQAKQTVDISMEEITNGSLSAKIKELKLDNVDINIKKTSSSSTRDKVDEKKMEEALKLKPSDCDCANIDLR